MLLPMAIMVARWVATGPKLLLPDVSTASHPFHGRRRREPRGLTSGRRGRRLQVPRHGAMPALPTSSYLIALCPPPSHAAAEGWTAPLVGRCQVHSDVKVAPTSDLKDGDNSSKNWRIKILYDGDCPLCMREVNMLRERNKSYGEIKFVDISSKDYSPDDNQGLDYETVRITPIYGACSRCGGPPFLGRTLKQLSLSKQRLMLP